MVDERRGDGLVAEPLGDGHGRFADADVSALVAHQVRPAPGVDVGAGVEQRALGVEGRVGVDPAAHVHERRDPADAPTPDPPL